MAYNCGVCADQIKKYADAVKYFDVAIQKLICFILSFNTPIFVMSN